MREKILLAGFLGCLILSVPQSARAEISLSRIGEVTDASFSDLADTDGETEISNGETEFYEDGFYGLKNGEGDVILEPVYEGIYPFYGGYAKVTDGDLYGLIDSGGSPVLPVLYDDIRPSFYMPDSEEGGYEAFGYFAAEKDGELFFVRTDGTVSFSPDYDAGDLDVKGVTAVLEDPEGNRTIISADGVETSLEGYSYCSCLTSSAGALYKVEDDSFHYGLLDWHGNELLPCEYTGISLSADGRYLLAGTGYSVSDLFEIAYDLTGSDG